MRCWRTERTYFVVFEDADYSAPDHHYVVVPTTSAGEDSGEASGWSIADDRYGKTGNGSWARIAAFPFQIAVRGQAADAPEPETELRSISVTPTPRVGVASTASLPDDFIVNVLVDGWFWEVADEAGTDRTRRAGRRGPVQGANTAAYTPVAADANRYLRVTVNYRTHAGQRQLSIGQRWWGRCCRRRSICLV